MMALPPEVAAGILYNELESEQPNSWTALLNAQSVGYVCFHCLNDMENTRF